jgi:hypothetical protein
MNVKDSVRFRLSYGCALKRLLSGHTLATFRTIQGSDWFTLNAENGDVRTAASFAANAEVGLILELMFEIVLRDYDEEDDLGRCICGSSHLRVPVSFEVVDGLVMVLNWVLEESGFIGNGSGFGSESGIDSTPEDMLYSPWTIMDGGLRLRLDFESSVECGPHFNPNNQSATAFALLQVDSLVTLSVHWFGAGELFDSGFDRMSLSIDGAIVATAHSSGVGGEDCSVGPVVSQPSDAAVSVELDSGEHTITISLTTGDGAYHKDAYYEFFFSF